MFVQCCIKHGVGAGGGGRSGGAGGAGGGGETLSSGTWPTIQSW